MAWGGLLNRFSFMSYMVGEQAVLATGHFHA
jgi:hypothetical protein